MDDERQKILDEEYIETFRFKAVYNNDSITDSEKEVQNGEELIALLQVLDKQECDRSVHIWTGEWKGHKCSRVS